jgi:hypothetical protein
MDPITFYKGSDEVRVAAIDAPAWIAEGWATEKKPGPEAKAKSSAVEAKDAKP